MVEKRVVILVLSVVVVAVGGAWAAPPRVVPWLDQRPVKASAHPPLALPCRGSTLRAQVFLQGATGSLVGGVNLLNAGSAPCSLLGWPKVSFTGAAASTTPLQVKELPRSHTQQEQEVAFSGRVGEGLSETTVKQVFGEFDYEFFPDLVIEMIHGTTEYQREWVPPQLGP